MKTRLTIFAGIMLFLAWLAPNHYPPWASFHADGLAAFALVPLALWSATRWRRLEPLAIGAILLSFVPLAQLLAGQIDFAGEAWIAWLYLVGFAMAAQCGANLVRDSRGNSSPYRALVPLQVSVVLAALVSSGIALHQWLDLRLLGLFIVELPKGSRPFANLSQPNQFASLLLLALAASAYLFEAGAVRSRIALGTGSIFMLALAMTQSRTAMLGLMLIWCAYIVLHRRAKLRTTYGALVAMTLIYVGLVSLWPSINDALLLQHGTSLAERMGDNLRITLWSSMIDAMGIHPWMGWGWGQVSAAQQATALAYPATHWWFQSAHNLVLDVALWSGVPIALLVTGGLLWWFVRCVQACRDPLAWCLLVGVGCTFGHAMVEFPLSYAYFLLPIGVLMGALGTSFQVSFANLARSSNLLARRAFPALTLASLAVFAKVAIEYVALEDEWRNIRLSRTFVGADLPPAAPNIHLLTQLKARATFARMDPSSRLSEQQLGWMGSVVRRYGVVTFMFPYAQALAVNGRMAEANHVLAVMCKTQTPIVCQKAMKEWADFKFPVSADVRADAEGPSSAP